eukprot:c6457_g1_i1.p1 GENE.c6457_g1_i1~~c6457_g1_i1.p1  ORF type:complete len:631 (-),score=101.24 c6457_g1_i1:52-1944(-)
MSDGLVCGQCRTLMDEGLHCPRFLECGHVYCSSCIQQLRSASRNADVVRCPEDYTCTVIEPERGVSGLPEQVILISQYRNLHVGAETDAARQCEACVNEHHVATHFCTGCSQYICTNRAEGHTFNELQSGHVILEVEEAVALHRAGLASVRCTEHPSEVCVVYDTKCQRMICRKCTDTDAHKEHKCLDDRDIDKLRGDLGEELRQVHDGIEILQEWNAKIRSSIDRVKHTEAFGKDEIAEFFAEVREMVNARERALLQEFSNAIKDRTFELYDHQNRISNILACARYCVETGEVAGSSQMKHNKLKALVEARKRVSKVQRQIEQLTMVQRRSSSMIRGWQHLSVWDDKDVFVETNQDSLDELRDQLNVQCPGVKFVTVTQDTIPEDETPVRPLTPGNADQARKEILAALERLKHSPGLQWTVVADRISDILSKNQSLTVIDTARKTYGDSSACALAKALQDNTSITRLSLENINLGRSGISEVVQMLHDNRTLVWLNVGNNPIRNDGAHSIAIELRDNTSLVELGLQLTEIGDDGAVAIASALRENTTLRKLILSGNQIGDTGAIALAGALEANTSLQELDLQSNSFKDKGATALLAMLAQNQSLRTLGYWDNKIDKKIKKQLDAATKRR